MAPEAYRSEAFYRAELDWVLPGSWVFVGHERWVPSPGDFLAETIGSEPVMVVRSADGVLRAFSNVCPHRASLLVEGRGNCGRRLVCPYHGWTFGLEGQLLAVPRQRGFVSPIDPDRLGLRELRLDVWEGLVFVNVTGDAPPLLDYLEDVPEILGGHGIASMHFGAFLDDPVAANWKLVMDNAVCDYHPRHHPRRVDSGPGAHRRAEHASGYHHFGDLGAVEGVEPAGGSAARPHRSRGAGLAGVLRVPQPST